MRRSAVRAAIFDLAGTLVDFGSRGPVEAFRQVFAQQGVPVTEAEVRASMGAAKRDHIAAMLAAPAIAARWREAHGRAPRGDDVETLYAAFLPVQRAVARDLSRLVPGVGETLARLREAGVAIAANTGYPADVTAALIPEIERQGVRFDAVVTASDVAKGRPAPDMLARAADALGLARPETCLAVDDSPPGLEAARAAGMWAVGVAVSGNAVGLGEAAWRALADAEKAARRATAAETLRAAGCHVVIDTAADLADALAAIDERLAAGETP